MNITIAVIGGTGKAGRYLVKELLKSGYKVKLLLRDPDKLQIPISSFEVIKGDARDYLKVRKFLEGTDVVISTLGQPKGEKSIFSDATKNVLTAMKELQLCRYILITGLNVDSPSDRKSEKTKFATDWMKKNYPETTMDKQFEFELLSQSNLDWTLLRLPLIELTDERRRVEVSLEDCAGENISATDLAYFLKEQITDKSFLQKAPFISNI